MKRLSKKKKNKVIAVIILFITLITSLYYWQKRATPKWSLRLFLSPYRGYRNVLEAQFRHETGDGTSSLYKDYHNLFGMGMPSARPASNNGPTKDKVEGQYMSSYRNNDQSIKDMIMYLTSHKYDPSFKHNALTYATALKARAYYGDSLENYRRGLERFL